MRNLLRKMTTAWRLWRLLGPRTFWLELKARLRLYQGRISRNEALLARSVPTEPAQLLEISVVIPVYNPGEDLEVLLASLHRQRGCLLDLVILDSGSTDGSRLTHSYPSIRWFDVPRADFSHSGTRNRGVELSRFPLVFLTVQDACLPDDTWLYRLATLFNALGVGALSTGETPRSDADAYARFAIDQHSGTIGLADGTTAVYDRFRGSRRDRVQAASLSNVACLYSRDLLLAHRFSGAFAEDFTLGMRLLEHRIRIGNTTELKIVHSHTRPAFYGLKRQFVARRHLKGLGLAEPDLEWTETTCLEFLHSFVLLSGTGGWDASFAWLESQDPALAEWLGGLGVAGHRTASRPGILTELKDEVLRYHRGDAGERPLLVLKALAGRVGWVLGGIPLEPWSPELRHHVESLARDI